MSEHFPRELGVQNAMEHPGTVSVGIYKMMKSGNSVGGRVPKEHARVMKLLDVGETEVFVNYELGVVMHRIPEREECGHLEDYRTEYGCLRCYAENHRGEDRELLTDLVDQDGGSE